MTPPTAVDIAAAQRRTMGTLVAGQVVGSTGITIGIATASLLAKDLSGSEQMAGLSQTCQVLGTAIAAYLLARLMSTRGRRAGLTLGYLLGAVGAVVVVAAGSLRSMPLLLVGAALLGTTTAANNAARYAATDLAPDESRGRALGLVVWAATIGAVLGPNLTGPASRLSSQLHIPALTGPFALGSIGMLAAAGVIWTLLRPDPLLLARERAGVGTSVVHHTSWAAVRQVLRERPVVGAAIGGLASAHAVMVAVMVMTPLHMQHGGSELRVIGFVISVHVLGMFAFAPVSGWAADRLGRPATMAVGGVVLLLALLVAGSSPEGSSWQIFTGMFLLGLGWSFGTVAASTLVVEEVPLRARTDVQGAADLVMGLSAAAAGALAGFIVGWLGYAALNLFAAAIAAVTLASAALARQHHARAEVAAEAEVAG
ncbi:MAG: MFS transporter [Nocardioidaceae bacterium]